VLPNESVILKAFSGSRLGVWIAHGEGRFTLKGKESDYIIPMKYGYEQYPANPNGSDYNAAALTTADGRHLAMMPHIERSVFPWQWAYYKPGAHADEVSPWAHAFVAAREWIELNNRK